MSNRRRPVQEPPDELGWVRPVPGSPAAEYVAEVSESSRVRAGQLLELCLQERYTEAELMISTVPDHELRALLVGCLAHAEQAYRQTVGPELGLAIVNDLKGRSSS